METLISRLKQDFPEYHFIVGEYLCWSPSGNEIFYKPSESESNISGLLHELAHAELGHHSYKSDVELLQKEAAAWEKAQTLAKVYDRSIDPNHAQDCLDTYRDWLYKRSSCPACRLAGVQQKSTQYLCLNCGQVWRVSNARFRRAYRLTKQKELQNN
ncbi:MAG TPA: hypothetical protein VLF91_06060 [Candidatus Saccharimonadales bacterium]|nr:hypothetical protein [Candidatus Saccharimonadales bacterium]